MFCVIQYKYIWTEVLVVGLCVYHNLKRIAYIVAYFKLCSPWPISTFTEDPLSWLRWIANVVSTPGFAELFIERAENETNQDNSHTATM